MKKILFALCALVLGLSAHAQTKGNIVVGGELELSTAGTKVSYTNDGTTNTTKGDGAFSGGIGVNAGYFIKDNLLVGLGLGYNGSSQEDGTDINRENDFYLTPYASYYVKLADKFYYTPTAELDFIFGNTSLLDTTDMSVRDIIGTFGFGIGLKPAAFEYRVSEKIALGLSLGELYFVTASNTQKISDTSKITMSASSFNIDVTPGINFTMKFYIK